MRLLAVGRLTYYKGLQTLLQALALVEGCDLLIVGEGEQRAALQQRIAQLGLEERVTLAGNLDDEMLDAAYRDADVLCLASLDRAEAF
jgi:glycosyltransferase involved in cell wall biosynthesis